MTETDQQKIERLEIEVQKLKAQIYEMESTSTDSMGNKYAVRDHPRFRNQPGNPYIPLDKHGKMQEGTVG